MTCGFAQADLDAIYGAMALDYTGWVVGFAPLMLGNAERLKLAQVFCRSIAGPVAADCLLSGAHNLSIGLSGGAVGCADADTAAAERRVIQQCRWPWAAP